jgi:hypothetical protein
MRERVSRQQTTQQLIRELLRQRPAAQPVDLKKALNDDGIRVSVDEVIDYIHGVKKTLDETEQVFVAPPECQDCGFDDWDNPGNIQSRCPEKDCRSERIAEPEFTIRGPESGY